MFKFSIITIAVCFVVNCAQIAITMATPIVLVGRFSAWSAVIIGVMTAAALFVKKFGYAPSKSQRGVYALQVTLVNAIVAAAFAASYADKIINQGGSTAFNYALNSVGPIAIVIAISYALGYFLFGWCAKFILKYGKKRGAQ